MALFDRSSRPKELERRRSPTRRFARGSRGRGDRLPPHRRHHVGAGLERAAKIARDDQGLVEYNPALGGDKARTNVQLNFKDVFEDGRLLRVGANPDG